MKKLLALCLSALVLVGCSSSNNATTTETSALTTSGATVETSALATEETIATFGKYVVTNTVVIIFHDV